MDRRLVFAILFSISLVAAGCTAPSEGNVAPGGAPSSAKANAAGSASNAGPGGGITFNTSVSVGGAFALPAATSGEPYNAVITPSGGTPPYACSAAPGTTLPGSLVFSEPGCSVTGGAPALPPDTPSAVYPVSFVVTDSKGLVGGPFNLDLEVDESGMQFYVEETLSEFDSVLVGRPYKHSFCDPELAGAGDSCGSGGDSTNPWGGTPPYHFVLESGSGFPPTGLTLNPNGLLSGTPANAGTSKFGVCAVDSVGKQACGETSLTVKDSFKMAVHATGDGEGNVTEYALGSGNPQTCPVGSDCTFYLEKGKDADLRHEEAVGTAFAGWSGACTESSCTPAMDSEKDVTATFGKFDLTVNSVACQFVTNIDLDPADPPLYEYNVIATGTAKGPKDVEVDFSSDFDDATKDMQAWPEALGFRDDEPHAASSCGAWTSGGTTACTNDGASSSISWTLGIQIRRSTTRSPPIILNVTMSTYSWHDRANKIDASKTVTCG